MKESVAVRGTIVEMRKQGMTFPAIAKALNERGIKTTRGMAWNSVRVASYFTNATRQKTGSAKKIAQQAGSNVDQAEFILGLIRNVYSSQQTTAVKAKLISALAGAYN